MISPSKAIRNSSTVSTKERKNKYCGCLDNFSTQSRVVKRLGAHLMKIRPLFGWGNGLQMCCRTKCSEIHYFNNYDTDRVKCGLVSFISSGLVRSRSEGATSSGHVRRSFTALGLCHNNRCDLTLRFYPAVASKCMAVTSTHPTAATRFPLNRS